MDNQLGTLVIYGSDDKKGLSVLQKSRSRN